uniref:NADP-dependent oxidoreductase domain-containing protein n=1 Tax=Acrobeloides nanus TaxID=290746 RepID=A0A914D016_9BILA
MEKLYREKKLRAIGVSNYNTNHLDELLAHASVLPAVNQCEYHPLYYQADLVNYCKEKAIHFQAYSSFGSESNKEDLLKNPKIISLASKYGCSVTNFLLAWSINQGISVLPRSRNPIHVKENFKALSIKLDAEDIEAAKASEQNKFCWNPSSIV